jgi:hypothetical protein
MALTSQRVLHQRILVVLSASPHGGLERRAALSAIDGMFGIEWSSEDRDSPRTVCMDNWRSELLAIASSRGALDASADGPRKATQRPYVSDYAAWLGLVGPAWRADGRTPCRRSPVWASLCQRPERPRRHPSRQLCMPVLPERHLL